MGELALVHEWLDAVGGAEQVFARAAHLFPEADRWALWAPNNAVDTLGLQESWLARTPLRARKHAALPFMPLAWRTLPRRRYETVLSFSHCFAHTVRFRSEPPAARYLSYVYAPMRYAWSPGLDPRAVKPFGGPARATLRYLDLRLSRHVDAYATLSQEVRTRIQHFWNRDAHVIYPHVDTAFFQPTPGPSPFPEYLLGVGRWVPYKRFDLIMEVGERAGLPVVIAGGGPESGALRERAKQLSIPVTFISNPTRERLRELYTGATALLFPVHEDFGLVPVEAMACGTPVVGVNRGGLLETVQQGVSGRLEESLDPAVLARAVHQVQGLDRGAVRSSVQSFGGDRFDTELRAWLVTQGAMTGADRPNPGGSVLS